MCIEEGEKTLRRYNDLRKLSTNFNYCKSHDILRASQLQIAKICILLIIDI